MTPAIARYLKETARKLGLEIQRYDTSGCEPAVLARFFSQHPVDLIIDVGANEGQYIRLVRAVGYRGRIIAFEPLAQPHTRLSQLAATDQNLTVWPRMALGDHVGEVEMNVSANLASSSILTMLDSHLAAAPHSAYVGREKVAIGRLDGCVSAEVSAARFAFLKIDTQGYEAAVLRGATGLLPLVRAVQMELSFIDLYEGQPLIHDMLNLMDEFGYGLYTFIPGFKDPASGRMLQCDGVFVRKG
jgi:FkbM family methyltransferase